MLRSRIDDLLWEKRLRPSEFIKRSGVPQRTLLRARKDQSLPSCKLETLETIAKHLGVKVKDLFEEV